MLHCEFKHYIHLPSMYSYGFYFWGLSWEWHMPGFGLLTHHWVKPCSKRHPEGHGFGLHVTAESLAVCFTRLCERSMHPVMVTEDVWNPVSPQNWSQPTSCDSAYTTRFRANCAGWLEGMSSHLPPMTEVQKASARISVRHSWEVYAGPVCFIGLSAGEWPEHGAECLLPCHL